MRYVDSTPARPHRRLTAPCPASTGLLERRAVAPASDVATATRVPATLVTSSSSGGAPRAGGSDGRGLPTSNA